MDILLVSHCVPNPPNKGEKIRAYHSLHALCRDFRVHLVCFARSREEVDDAQALSDRCASVFAEPLSRGALPAAAVRFALGGCLNLAYYRSASLQRHIRELAARVPLRAGVALSLVSSPYIPRGIPWVLDMQDVDSEKWYEYAANRRPSLPYRIEADRLRAEEILWARRANETIFTTFNEEQLFLSFAPGLRTAYLENGVDFDYFDPSRCPVAPDLAGRRYVVFTGTMDYWPNIDAAQWFATKVLPELRRQAPDMEFFIVGRNPQKSVQALAALPGVLVTGAVPDIRGYLQHAQAVVTPLRIARGIQNKVLEGLAMGKPVLVSEAVSRTFGAQVPYGVSACDSPESYIRLLKEPSPAAMNATIRHAAFDRFNWTKNLNTLRRAVTEAAEAPRPVLD